jgi:hypothetical protein
MGREVKVFSRAVVTPITAALFVVVAFTGILLLVGASSGPVEGFHILASILFVIFAVIHLALNWACFVPYLKRPATIVSGAVCAVVIVFIVASGDLEAPHGPGGMGILRRIETAPLGDVAPLLGISVEDAAAMLRQRGLSVSGEEQTIDNIARSSGRHPQEVLSVLAMENPDLDEP